MLISSSLFLKPDVIHVIAQASKKENYALDGVAFIERGGEDGPIIELGEPIPVRSLAA
jgi:hypothetical protein